MVLLESITESNSRLSTLPPGLVAVFIGATAGIGEVTLKKFAQYARQPRAYLVGRSQSAADRIIASCKEINSDGEYIFIKADVSLIKNVDDICRFIKLREKAVNFLLLTAAIPVLDNTETSEGLPLLSALNFYSRHRFITNLLPLLQQAKALRRVVTVASGSYEGYLDATNLPGRGLSLLSIRRHIGTLITLGLEPIAKRAPEVSFVHEHPGTVNTSFMQKLPGVLGVIIRTVTFFVGRWAAIPIEESGERHLFLATSGRFPPVFGAEGNNGIYWDGEVARGTNAKLGSGVYSVGWNGECASPAIEKLLAEYREKGMVEEIWKHAETELQRIALQYEE